MHSTGLTEEEDSSELERFRQEWLAELRNRRAAAAGAKGKTISLATREEIDAVSERSNEEAFESLGVTATSTEAVGSSTQFIDHAQPKATSSAHLVAAPLPRSLGHALTVYRRAVQHEQKGNFDKAIELYRQAFRRDPHVDRVYHREEALASISAAQKDPLQQSAAREADNSVNEITHKMHASLSIKSRDSANAHHTLNARSQILVNLLQGFPDDISFKPENEEEPMPLGGVPDELLVMFLTKLDTTSIERFAAVSRKARVIALESVIWRELVGATYKPPQVGSDQEITEVLERCLYDYRRVYIEHPRVRLDGVYIATCHYVRPGRSDNSWVNINHLITYHRYLRFYPDGQVLSLLANEEFAPQQVIPLLKPNLRMKASVA
ncbi:hypothetical protein H0H92_012772 [Tricholoma furcatifolium]|nr:hypothetical protein H0H92_012772 [Tricholoma furcatifolium]